MEIKRLNGLAGHHIVDMKTKYEVENQNLYSIFPKLSLHINPNKYFPLM